MRIYGTYEEISGMEDCCKAILVVKSKLITGEVQVISLEGNYAKSKVGDYIMKGIDGELYICDGSVYDRSYLTIKPGFLRSLCLSVAKLFLGLATK